MSKYEFVRMERWKSRNPSGLGYAYFAQCRNGDKYLTFDIRREEDRLIPVFSPICKIGGKNGHTEEAYKFYREQFLTLDGYDIQAVFSCKYRDLNNIKNIHNFEYDRS